MDNYHILSFEEGGTLLKYDFSNTNHQYCNAKPLEQQFNSPLQLQLLGHAKTSFQTLKINWG